MREQGGVTTLCMRYSAKCQLLITDQLRSTRNTKPKAHATPPYNPLITLLRVVVTAEQPFFLSLFKLGHVQEVNIFAMVFFDSLLNYTPSTSIVAN